MITLVLAALLPLSPVADPTPRPLIRLDPRVVPTGMELRLDVDPDRDFLTGNAILNVRLPERTRTVRLHGRALEVRRVRVNGAPATWAQLDDEGTAEITAEGPVGPGVVTVDVEYRAKLGAVLEGVYVTSTEGRKYLSTQFEAISARDAFPCFDEPGFKTPVALTLFIDDGDVAAANTPEVARATLPDGRVRVTFAKSAPLPAYLIAFAVGPWDIVEGPVLPAAATRKLPLPIRALVPKGQGAKVKTALQMTAATVRAIERYTGVGYAYGKLDIVAVPDFAWGGMENAALITYRDARLYLEDGAPVEWEKRTLGLVAHEVAHQWFGDLVTARWWDDIWLNEAFATWMAFRAVEEIRPDFFPRAEFRDYTEYVLAEDSLISARRVRQPIETKADILDAFDGVTYGKGASVIRMFEGFVGREAFRRGIRAYLTEHRHGNADARELIDAVSRNARVDVRAPFFSFLDQAGVPFLEADVVCEGAPRLVIKQSRFLPVGSKGSTAQSWTVPVCVTADGREICQMLTTTEGAIDLGPGCPKAVLPDAGGRGYYRWSLPPEELRPLVDGSVRLSAEEKIAVGDALRAGFQSARLSFADALALALPLAQDDNPIVAETPGWLLGFAHAWAEDPKMRARVAKRIKAAYGPVKDKVGLIPNDAASESAERRELRLLAVRALVTDAEDEATQRELLPLARARFGIDTGVVDERAAPADLTDVLGAALVSLEPGAADKLMARLATEQNPQHRRDVLRALATTSDADTARKLLALTFGKSLLVNERLSPLSAVADDPRTRALAFSWAEANVDALFPALPEANAGDVPLAFSGACSEAEAVRVEALFTPRAAQWPIERTLAQTLERIRLCVSLRAAHDKSVRSAL